MNSGSDFECPKNNLLLKNICLPLSKQWANSSLVEVESVAVKIKTGY